MIFYPVYSYQLYIFGFTYTKNIGIKISLMLPIDCFSPITGYKNVVDE